jgi:hypothetical protein
LNGKISTNFGEGYMYELVKDDVERDKPAISLSLHDYLSSDLLLQKNFDRIVDELKTMKEKMLLHEIITMGLFIWNILCKKDSENSYKLILINDMGSVALVPIEYYFTFAAHARINRKWKKFVKYLAKKYTDPLVHELIKQIR